MYNVFLGTYDLEHIKAIRWGREHEAEGIKSLETSLNAKVTKTGLWLHACGFLGASPDGLLGEDAIVEVKCPFKYRENLMLENIKQHKNYIIFADVTGNISINEGHEYFLQIQGELVIRKRKLCHSVIWTPKEVVIVQVEAQDFSKNINVLKQIYLNQYVKFVLGEHYTDQEKYCGFFVLICYFIIYFSILLNFKYIFLI